MSTCTVPGHSSCSITCKGGCMAVYVEPDGPCRTRCTKGKAFEKLPDGINFSISISEMPASDVVEILKNNAGAKFTNLKKGDELISYSEKNVSIDKIISDLDEIMS